MPDDTRVQAPELAGPEALRPTGAPPDTFAAAAKAPEDNRLGQLAQSLGAFHTDLLQAGRAYQIDQRYHKDGSDADALKGVQSQLSQMTPQEIIAADKGGKLPWSPVDKAQTYVQNSLGEAYASDLGKQAQAKVASGEMTPDQVPSWLQTQREQIAGQWGNDDARAPGFGRVFNGLLSAAQSSQISYNGQQLQKSTLDAYSTQIGGVLDQARANNWTPAQTWDALNKAQGVAGHMAGINPQQRDAVLMSRLGTYNDPNFALSIANADRPDVNGSGQSIPGPGKSNNYVAAVKGWQTQANTNAVNDAENDAKAGVSASVLKAFQTNPAALLNVPAEIGYHNAVTGSGGTVKKEAAVNEAVNATLGRDNQRIASGQATTAQVLDEQLQSFPQAGIKQPQWEQTLKAAAHGGPAADQGQQLAAFGLYKQLQAKNPNYLGTLVDQKSRDLYNTAVMQQQLFGKDDATAMQLAQQAWADPKSPEEARLLGSQRDNIEAAAHTLYTQTGGMFTDRVKNPEIAKEALVNAAWSLVKINHMDPAEAVKKAQTIATDHFVTVNNMLVPDMGYLPKEQLAPAATQLVKDWATGPAKAMLAQKGITDPKGVSIASAGDGRFMAVDANTGVPISAPRTGASVGGLTYFSAHDLVEASKHIPQAQPGLLQRVFGGGEPAQTTDQAAAAASQKIGEAQQRRSQPAANGGYSGTTFSPF